VTSSGSGDEPTGSFSASLAMALKLRAHSCSVRLRLYDHNAFYYYCARKMMCFLTIPREIQLTWVQYLLLHYEDGTDGKKEWEKWWGSFIICAIKAIKQNWMRWAGYVLHAWKTTVQTFCEHV
jgi:hypothetical protein